jgi:hypothetical protein
MISCKEDTFEIKGEPVNLIANESPYLFAKTVILFDDNNYLIKTPLDSFIIGHPFYLHDGYYNSYKDKAVNDSRTLDVLYVDDYMPYEQDTIYTLAYHLENGSCYMWDKKAKRSIKTIYVEKYSEGGPMASREGRRFYIKDQLFFYTVDMISK